MCETEGTAQLIESGSDGYPRKTGPIVLIVVCHTHTHSRLHGIPQGIQETIYVIQYKYTARQIGNTIATAWFGI